MTKEYNKKLGTYLVSYLFIHYLSYRCQTLIKFYLRILHMKEYSEPMLQCMKVKKKVREIN